MKKILFVLAMVFTCFISNGQKLLYVNLNLVFPQDTIIFQGNGVYGIYRGDSLITTYKEKNHNIVMNNFPKDTAKFRDTFVKYLMADEPPYTWKDIIVWRVKWVENDYGKSNIEFQFELPCGQTKTLKKVEVKLNFYNNIDEYVTSKTFTATGYQNYCDEFWVDYDLYLPNYCDSYKIAYVKTYFTDGSVSLSYNKADKAMEARVKFNDKYTIHVWDI